SIQNRFDLFSRKLHFNFLFDYKGGGALLDQTSNIQCAQSNSCKGASDINASLEEQARNIATRNANPTSAVGFLWPNQFWRFREMSVVWNLPKSVVKTLRA